LFFSSLFWKKKSLAVVINRSYMVSSNANIMARLLRMQLTSTYVNQGGDTCRLKSGYYQLL